MKLLSAIRLLLTLHCEESSQLLSREFEEPLSSVERWAVRLHQLSCARCRTLKKQLLFLETALRLRAQQPAQLSSAARRRMANCICAACNGKA